MAGEFPEVPNEAKSFNDMVAWAAENGQSESAQNLISAIKDKDWDSALNAANKLDDWSELADKAGDIGKHFETLDRVNKALEVIDAVEKGDYEYAVAKVGAEAVDSIASGYLDSLGPGGMMVNYAAHETGDMLSGYLTEAQQFSTKAGEAMASGDGAVVAAYKNNREFMDSQIREQLEAGRSPEEVAQWSRDHMETHGAIYRNLDEMAGNGDAYANRFEKDLEWSAERAEQIAKELDPPEVAPKDDGEPGLFGKLAAALETYIPDVFKAEPAQEAVETQPEPTPEPEPELQDETEVDPAPEPVVAKTPDPAPVPDPATASATDPTPTQPPVVQTQVQVNVDVTLAQPDTQAPVIDAQPVAAVSAAAVSADPATTKLALDDPAANIEIPLPEPTREAQIEAPIYEPEFGDDAPLVGEPDFDANEPPEATEIVIDTEMTETDKLDAYVSQMAREAEAEAREEALADAGLDVAPPAATEVVVIEEDTAHDDVVHLAQPLDEHSISENYDEQPDDSSYTA